MAEKVKKFHVPPSALSGKNYARKVKILSTDENEGEGAPYYGYAYPVSGGHTVIIVPWVLPKQIVEFPEAP